MDENLLTYNDAEKAKKKQRAGKILGAYMILFFFGGFLMAYYNSHFFAEYYMTYGTFFLFVVLGYLGIFEKISGFSPANIVYGRTAQIYGLLQLFMGIVYILYFQILR